MRFGWPGSVLAHAVMLAAMVVAWPRDEPDLPPASAVVPIDIIDTISDVTNISAVAPEPLEDTPETEELAMVGATRTLPPPEPDAPEAIPDPRQKQKPKEKSRSMAEDLRRYQEMINREKEKDGNRGGSRPNTPTGPAPREGVGAGTEATASEADAIMAHVQRCWRAPADLPYPERLVVKVRIRLNADGSLASQPELVSPRSLVGLDPATRVAAEAALRAVRVCEPFPMRANRTERVSALLNFDPRRMAGAY